MDRARDRARAEQFRPSGVAMVSKRIQWIDALRVIVVLSIFAFHSARVFDSLEPFYAKSTETSLALSVFVAFLNVWQMPLLFILAGMSTFFALGKRTGGQYLLERTKRLLVPFLFGCLVIVPPQVWYGVRTNLGYTGSLVQFYGDYFTLKWGTVSDYLGGPSFGHLWFILFLFIVSAVSLPLFLWLRRGGEGVATRTSAGLAKPYWWLLLAFVLLISGAFPDLGGHNPFTFLVWFVVGYLLAQTDAVVQLARKARWWLLGSGVALSVPVLLTYDVRDRFPDPSWPIALNEYGFQLAAWLLCLGAIGVSAAYLDRAWRWLPYMAEASYPTYILHQTVIVVAGYYLVSVLPQPLTSWAILTVVSIASAYAIYEVLVRRWAPIRFLFGMKPKAKASTT
jgi:glucans biosynthesis protein C